MAARTGAERYFADRLKDPAFRDAHEAATRRIQAIDAMVNGLDARREQMGLSKAEVARRAGLRPEVIRRLFSNDHRNPTLSTLVAVSEALDLEIVSTPRSTSPASPSRRGSSRTRKRAS